MILRALFFQNNEELGGKGILGQPPRFSEQSGKNLKVENKGVAITGMGSICAAGNNVAELWQGLSEARVNCVPVPERLFSVTLPYPVFAAPAGPLTGAGKALLLQSAPHFELTSVSRTIRLAFNAVAEALEQADIDLESLRGKRLGIALGTTVGCTFHDEPYYIAWRKGEKPALDPVHYYLNTNVAAAVHGMLGTTGLSLVVTNACASGTDAIGLAKGWIEAGLCDIAIAGGADELSRVAYNGFVSLMLTNTDACRPFDQERNGLNIGEGAGVVILESEASVRDRDAKPVGWVKGYGAAADAYHPTAPHPEGRGLRAALKQAFLAAGIEKNQLGLINAHGTGTPANDIAETTALASFFDQDKVPVVSTKGITGHTLGAAGGIEAILTIEALRRGETVGTVGCHTVDPAFPVRPLAQGESAVLNSRIGLSESLAFGGSNAVLVLEAAS